MTKSKIIVSLVFIFTLISCNSRNKTEKDASEVRQKEYRSVTVINKASDGKVSECTISTDKGVNIQHQNKKTESNIVFKNLDEKNAFKDEKKFKVTVKDRYGMKYEKQFEMKEKGNTDVVVTDKDYVPQKGDWKKKLERKIN